MNVETEQHVDPLQLVNYVRGSLSRPEAQTVREHCRDCAPCGDQLAAIILLRRRAGVPEPATTYWRPAAAAAAALLVVAVGALLVIPGIAADDTPTSEVAGASEAAPEAPAPVVDLPWDPREEPFFVRFVGMLGEDLGNVTQVSSSLPHVERARASTALTAGNYNEAAAALANATGGNDRLALGIARFFAGDAIGAERALAPIIAPPTAEFETLDVATRLATATLAAAYIENGDLEAARAFLANVESLREEAADRVVEGLIVLRDFAWER